MTNMVSKERARSAIYKALREEFNFTVSCDADALQALRDIDSRDLMDLVMEIEYDLDASIDTDKLGADFLDGEDVDAMLGQLVDALY